MTRLSPDAYLAHLRADSDRLRTAFVAADPTSRVPGCPDWTAADLLQHLTGVQTHWSEAVAVRPAEPEHRELVRAGTPEGMLADSRAATDRLVDLLGSLDPATEVWNWSPDHTVGFLLRRQAHEALIHRVDAEQAAGAPTPLDPVLAADGVHEALDVMFGGAPVWGAFTPTDDLVRVDARDTDTAVWVRLGHVTGSDPSGGRELVDQPDLRVVDDPGVEPDVVVEGHAADLDLWLWRRGGDAEIQATGDPAVYARFRAIVDQPID